MAVPVVTRTGQAQSKTAGTTLVCTLSTTSYSTGDYVEAVLGLDPATGTVSFAATGTATVGSWTAPQDVSNGSGTSGVRLVVAYAKVTAGGTVLTVTATHPSVTARAMEVFRAAGADGTTPVQVSANNGGGPSTPSMTPTQAGVDAVAQACAAVEQAAGTVTSTPESGWTTSSGVDTAMFGTSGGNSASNISAGSTWYEATSIPSTAVSPSMTVSGSGLQVKAALLWQATPQTTATGSLTLGGSVTAKGAGSASGSITLGGTVFPSPPVLTGGPSGATVALSWSPATGTSYEVRRGGTLIGTTTATSFVDSPPSNATSYSYTVRAVNSAGTSGDSNTLVVPFLTYSAEVLVDTPVAFWRLNETGVTDWNTNNTTGTVHDSGNKGATRYPGKYLGPRTFTSGGSGPTLEADCRTVYFDNSPTITSVANSQRADFGNVLGLTGTSFTIEGWVRLANTAWCGGTGDWNAIASKGESSWQLRRFASSGNTVISTAGVTSNADAPQSSSITWNAAAWIHVALVVNDTAKTKTLYVNGVSNNSSGYTGSLGSSTASVLLCQNPDYSGGNRAVDAYLSEWAVYDTALSGARVAAHYAAALVGTVQTASTGSITLGGSGTARAAATAAGSVALGGAVSLGTTATGSLTLAGSAAWAVTAVTGSLTLGGTATAQAAATATGSLSLSGTATQSSVASGSLTLSGTATAKAAATASGSLTLSGAATWTAVTSGSLTLGGAATWTEPATGSLTLTGTASTVVTGITGSLTLGASSTWTAVPTGSLTLAGSVTAKAAATGSGSVTLSGTGLADGSGPTSAAGTLALGGSASAAAPTTAAGSLTLAGAASFTVGGTAGSVTLAGTATAAAPTAASGQVSLTGTSSGAAPVTSTGTITLAGTAFATVRVTPTGQLTLTATGQAAAAAIGIAGGITLTGGALATTPPTVPGHTVMGLTPSATAAIRLLYPTTAGVTASRSTAGVTVPRSTAGVRTPATTASTER